MPRFSSFGQSINEAFKADFTKRASENIGKKVGPRTIFLPFI